MFEKQKSSHTEKAAPEVVERPPESSIPTTAVSASRAGALIGATIKIKGEVTGDENLVIEGRVEGTVNLGTKSVTIGQSGIVSADVEAQVIKVDGEVKGNMTGIEKVIVTRTGKVQGNIVAPRVTLEDGAKFKGSIDMNPVEQTSKEKSTSESPVTPINSASSKPTENTTTASASNNQEASKPAKNG